MKVAVVSYLATYGNAPLLARAIRDLGHDIRLIIRYANAPGQDDFGFAEKFPHWEIQDSRQRSEARKWLKDVDRIIVMAIPALLWTVPRLFGDDLPPGAIILSSSHLMMGMGMNCPKGEVPVDYNCRQIEESGLTPFVQPHKYVYVERLKPRVWFPPIDVPELKPKATDRILIGHAPGKPKRWHWKGTDAIRKVFDEINAYHQDIPTRCDILPQMPHAELLAARRRYHIFIDQICPPHPVEGYPDYCGGLDKAGLEAMAAGCAVITSGGPFEFDHENQPPILKANEAYQLERGLGELIDDPHRRRSMGEAGRAWVIRNSDPAGVAARILEAIE